MFCGSLSTLLHLVLASSFLLWQDFSKRARFPIVCVDWFYKKAVSGVVKSWEFEGILSCSKILRIRRKNSMKWVLSILRDYWVYLEITFQSFKIWEFWWEFWGIETFIPKLLVRLLWFFRRTAALFRQIRTFPQLFRFFFSFGEFWNPTNCEKFNADGSLMGRTNLNKSVW